MTGVGDRRARGMPMDQAVRVRGRCNGSWSLSIKVRSMVLQCSIAAIARWHHCLRVLVLYGGSRGTCSTLPDVPCSPDTHSDTRALPAKEGFSSGTVIDLHPSLQRSQRSR